MRDKTEELELRKFQGKGELTNFKSTGKLSKYKVKKSIEQTLEYASVQGVCDFIMFNSRAS